MYTQARFPKGMYTCVSGFVEHAESVESAAAREVAEETRPNPIPRILES